MQQTHQPFIIYNASAGSGKTYTLVKAYLKILLKSNHPAPFKRILAITFTNKAVAEMKARIIEMLKLFSDVNTLANPNPMFKDICDDLKMKPKHLLEKSKNLLNTILHNYAAFDISTIDGFTHKLIRTFAFDLKLPLNFEVELDQDSLLNEAVDSLIAKAGTDDELTKILVDFAIEKADDDRSYDIAFDFNKIAKLLVNENELPFLETLKGKTLQDFKALKTQLKKEIAHLEKNIVEHAGQVLKLIAEAGLKHTDFSRGTLPNHFKKASTLNFNGLYNNKLEEYISEKKGVYNKTLDRDLANTIEALLPEIEVLYKTVKSQVFHLKFLRAFYRNVTPLSVLNAINNELTTLKLDQNKMLISEFNGIISKEIAAQPTPFIYERLGEKFKHYFIDEFQDTSIMQWKNLIPLLDNSLSGLNGSTMLVGDAKQAIYRWRGGKAEQFIGLFNDDNPFNNKKHVENLPSNFRSFKEIVNFNNGFFKFLSQQVFTSEDYRSLYENAHQNVTKEEEGYLSLSFLHIEKDDNRDEVFTEAVLKTIHSSLENGFKFKDICVLVRKKKEGVAIADYLSQHQVPIISSETLLINNSPKVVFINDFLALLMQPENNEIKIKVLNYLAILFSVKDKHDFFSKHINLSIKALLKSFDVFNVFVDVGNLLQLPLYDLAETIVRRFSLVKTSNAYIQFYLDVVLDFSQKKGSDISGFLIHFENKKESLSIISPQGQNAVQIMTIHKSKGLEFPVVIFPYADLDIYSELESKKWFSLDKDKYNGFSHTLLNYNKDFENYGDEGLRIYNKHKSEKQLDNINLLYVALTRPVEQMHIISTKNISSKGIVNTNKYSGLLISYLQHLGLWNDSELNYSFGDSKTLSKHVLVEKETFFQDTFISTAKEDHNIKIVTKSGLLWDTSQEEAIEKGNLIHNIMAKIKTLADMDSIIDEFLNTSTIHRNQVLPLKKTILQILEHPQIARYYTDDYTIYNERDIITKNGMILRPDRIVINSKNEATIIDYKTGFIDKKHEQQLQTYQGVLEEMQIIVKKKVLIYINENIIVQEI